MILFILRLVRMAWKNLTVAKGLVRKSFTWVTNEGMNGLISGMTTVTSGFRFIDIDAFSCVYAYRELLRLQGKRVQAVITAPLNMSIIGKYRSLDFYQKDQETLVRSDKNRFVIVDVSDPEQIESFVDVNGVLNVFDHHPGFEEFWREKIGAGAVIEPIGAAATLIVREYRKAGLLPKISPMAAELLAVAILSNTLNFQARISTDEDRNTYDELKQYFSIPADFEAAYFSKVQADIEANLPTALRDDSKRFNIGDKTFFIAQLEVWNGVAVMGSRSEEIERFLRDTTETVSFLNLIELGKGRNTLMFRDLASLGMIRACCPEFDYDLSTRIATTPQVILRKEILPRLREYSDCMGLKRGMLDAYNS